MNFFAKVLCSVGALVVGAVVAKLANEVVGSGQYLIYGAIAMFLLYLWGESSAKKAAREQYRKNTEGRPPVYGGDGLSACKPVIIN